MKKSRRQHQQPPPPENGQPSEGSTDSCDEATSPGDNCPHIVKAVNLKIKKNLKKAGLGTECPTCKRNDLDPKPTAEGDAKPSLWICLQCGNLGCGRKDNGHAMEHYKKPHSDCHYIVADVRQWTVWCYQCETEINIACRKMLQETVEFLKKLSTAPIHPLQTGKASQSQLLSQQVENESEEKDKDKDNEMETLVDGVRSLPKVGGLLNLGNTCFFNAVLQCLAQTPFLVKVLDDLQSPGQKFVLPGGKHKPANSEEEVDLPPIEGALERCSSFTSILCKTLTEMQNTTGRQPYLPLRLLASFTKKTSQCMDGGQHDSHELLRHLLELVRNEDLRRYQLIILKEVGLNGKTNPEGVNESLKSRIKFYGNQANARLLGPELVFRGVLVSTLECLDCHHSSQRTEPFLDLSLPVMADKPQPPVLKRKNSGFEDAFEVTHAPSKHQLKKEKKAARKNRKNRRHQPNSEMMVPAQNIQEENNGSVLESEESDADVEDNVEAEALLPEVGESGYGSEKPSALGSPVSPSSFRPVKRLEPLDGLPLNDYLPLCGTEDSQSEQARQSLSTSLNTPNSPSPTDASITELMAQPKLVQSVQPDRLESSESPDNDAVQPALSLSTSLVVNSDLTSPEGPTASLSSMTSKESPSSPGLLNGESSEKQDRPLTLLDLIEPMASEERAWSGPENRRSGRRLENSLEELREGVNGVNVGLANEMSRLALGGGQSPTRYSTKEGECSVQSCLNQFTALELMSGSNKVGCEACTERERKAKGNCKMVCTSSTKQYLISKVPAVLILHLKRFQSQGVDFRKVTKHVSFPMVLDLAPVCKDHRKSRIYSLYGVVEHSGTIHGGHYVSYVKSRVPLAPDDPRWRFLPSKEPRDNEDSSSESEMDEAAASPATGVEPPPGKWYFVSDSRVAEVDEQTVLQSQAYLLFYERIL